MKEQKKTKKKGLDLQIKKKKYNVHVFFSSDMKSIKNLLNKNRKKKHFVYESLQTQTKN